ncbi:hypothetical protein SDC9_181398 [bioreactor metagenome]|uniref:Uncharacterized protein n=1 Tax=bioreactor metagenome TaxID=1076179 RepID=A0A645H5Z3_9ZZZZ
MQMMHTCKKQADILFHLNCKDVTVCNTTINNRREYVCSMNQGSAQSIGYIAPSDYAKLIAPLGLRMDDLASLYPLQVVTTGLPYLIVSISSGLERAGIFSKDYESLVLSHGAKFV